MNTPNRVFSFNCGFGSPTILQAVCLVAGLVAVPVLAQKDMGCSPTVANPCTGGGGSNSGAEEAGRRARRWVDCNLFNLNCPEEPARDQRRNEALAANSEAIQFQKKGDWARAVALFQEAANKDPSDPIIQQNLANARQGLARMQQEQARLRAEEQEKAAAERMSKSIQDLAQSLSVAPAPSGPIAAGLDFDGRDAVASPAAGKASSSAGGGLNFTAVLATAPTSQAVSSPANDPRVVDARNVRSGLSPAVDKAIEGVFASAPPGVNDRVRKGFQAVATGDWKVAEAWFADALNRDPGNVALKNMLAATRSSIAPARTAQRGSQPRDAVADLYAKGWDAVATGDRSGALVALEAAINRDPKPSGWVNDYVAYLRASIAAEKNQALLLPNDSDMQFLFPDTAPSATVPARKSGQAGTRPAAAPPATPLLRRVLDAMTGAEKPGVPRP